MNIYNENLLNFFQSFVQPVNKMGFLTVLGYGVGMIALAVGLVKLYFKMAAGVCKSKRRIDGQVAIITGANSGT